MRLIRGDYVPDKAGGFEKCRDIEEKLERVLFKLNCRKGGFALMPNLGSRLHLLLAEKREYRDSAARKYILEALEGETGLTLSGVSVNDTEEGVIVKAEMKYNGDSARLAVHLS